MNNQNQNINFGLPEPSDEELESIEKEIERLVQILYINNTERP